MDNERNQTESKSIPAAALACCVGSFELGDNGDSAKTKPFRMVARSGGSIDHWYWGKCVHDFDGMSMHKNKVAIDYAHDTDQILGYAGKFEIESGDLVASGALIPYKDGDRAAEVIHKAAAGVPYEASINFGGDGLEIEQYLDESTPVVVNGQSFTAPVTIFRNWPLRGIAVCPYGADMNTSTSFNQENKGPIMAQFKTTTTNLAAGDIVEPSPVDELIGGYDEPNKTEEEAAPAVESEDDDKATEDAAEAESVEVATEPVDEATPEPVPLADVLTESKTGKDYLERFGRDGGVWFAEEKEWDECVILYENNLHAEIAELRQRLAATDAGEKEPVNFQSEQVVEAKRGLAGKVRIQGRKYQ